MLLTSITYAVDVDIPDPNLEAALREALGKPTGALTDTDLASLTSLSADNRGIVVLTGLEYCINLQNLYLHGNQISDIAAVSGLTNLQFLILYSNKIIDITAVAGLTNLNNLLLSSNQIRDITAVAGLTNLQYHLYLDSNQISDITAVAGLTNLQYLFLGYNQISDITAVAGLTNLQGLYLEVNEISNITAVSGLTNLQELWLSYNEISNITAVSGLTNLRCLELGSNQISDITAVAGLTNLRGLYLYKNQISNITAVAGLTNLQTLSLYFNQISDITAVAGLINLTQLLLPFNQISDIAAVVGLTYLQNLWLHSNQISDITAVEGLTKLTQLSLYSNQISDITAVEGLTNLQYLYLYSNQISDLQPLVNNPGIGSGDYVVVSYNPLNSASFNTHIPALQAKGVDVFYTPYSGNVQLIDQNPSGTWNYQLNHSSGSIYGWEYNGSAITGASVDGAAQAAGWSVVTQTSARVLFATYSPLGDGSLTGFHITGSAGGTGTFDVSTNQGSIDGPLPVELSAFSGASTPDGVHLRWRTQSEMNNLGFHVYRSWSAKTLFSLPSDGEYVRLTSTIIKGLGTDATPHDYSFLDETVQEGHTYWYVIEDLDFSGVTGRSHPIQVTFQRKESYAKVFPTKSALLQNFPNPFNPETWIPFQLAQNSDVIIQIYDVRGRLVREMALGKKASGIYHNKDSAAYWDGKNAQGETVASGVYLYTIKASDEKKGSFVATRKMVMLK
jgi:Leucine-rich repeat (LRR) protein